MYGRLVDHLRPLQRRFRAELYQGISAPIGDVANRAVYLEIGFYPRREIGLAIELVRIRRHARRRGRQRLLEDADVSVCTELVVRSAPGKLVFAVHLRSSQSE